MTEGPCRRYRPLASDEARARDRVVATLRRRFPLVAPDVVEAEVTAAWSALDEATVRTYVPVLATRAAADALGRIPSHTDPAPSY